MNRVDKLSDHAVAIWRGGVSAVLGDRAVQQHVEIEDDCLVIDDHVISLASLSRLIVVGAGKAAGSMAAGLLHVVDGRLPVVGAINVAEGATDGLSLGNLAVCIARPQGSNEPTQAAADGTRRIIDLVSRANPNDLCITLLSGGASALLVAPADGISLADKLAVTRHLSAAGATIAELNTVRKQLSRVKGGGLARASRAGRNMTLVLSDVIGDQLQVIGSGPTVANTQTAADALAVLDRFDPGKTLPPAVYRLLRMAPTTPQPTPDYPAVLVGNNAAAIDAAGVVAERLGYSHAMNAATGPEGTAEEVGARLAAMAMQMLASGPPQPDCLITGGEPTVCLPPAEICGKGGRNQQVVLAAMVALQQHPDFRPEHRDRLTILSGGTDGEDGPTDAAGAMLTAGVWQAADDLGLPPADFLHRKDAYTFFRATGGLLHSGPTGTNVCDLRVVVIER